MYKFKEVRAEYQKGSNFSKIGQTLKMNRKTARKYALSNTPPVYKPRVHSGKDDAFEPFKEQVLDKLGMVPDWGGSEIFEWIRGRGYSGSERTVFRRLREIKEGASKERFFEQLYSPGQQGQVDFKESVEVMFTRGAQVVNIFFGTLPYSNKCFTKAFPNKNYECFIDGAHSFFEKIGGIPEVLRLDNLSPCVKKVLKEGGRLYTDSFLKAIEYYGFEASACSPGKGNEKGDVERDIQTYSRRIKNYLKVEGIIFRDFDHLNEVLEQFSYQFTDEAKFKEEVLQLRTLPSRNPLVLHRIVEQRASAFGTVKISKEVYSVPDEVIGTECRIEGGPFEVTVIQKNTKKVVAKHPRISEGEKSILLEHVIKSLVRKPRAMIHWYHQNILFPETVFKKFYEVLKKSSHKHTPEREYLMSLNLIHHTSLNEIKVGMEILLENNQQVSFEALRNLILGERRPTPVNEISLQYNQVPLNPDLKKYDALFSP